MANRRTKEDIDKEFFVEFSNFFSYLTQSATRLHALCAERAGIPITPATRVGSNVPRLQTGVQKLNEGLWNLNESKAFEDAVNQFGEDADKVHACIPTRTLKQVKRHLRLYQEKKGKGTVSQPIVLEDLPPLPEKPPIPSSLVVTSTSNEKKRPAENASQSPSKKVKGAKKPEETESTPLINPKDVKNELLSSDDEDEEISDASSKAEEVAPKKHKKHGKHEKHAQESIEQEKKDDGESEKKHKKKKKAKKGKKDKKHKKRSVGF